MGVDIAEGIIVQEIGEALGPEFCGYVVAVDCALFVQMILALFLRDSTVDVKRVLVEYGRVVLSLQWLICCLFLGGFGPSTKVDGFDGQALHHLRDIHDLFNFGLSKQL